jgi:hypothetical protein
MRSSRLRALVLAMDSIAKGKVPTVGLVVFNESDVRVCATVVALTGLGVALRRTLHA